jgi:tRNA A37 threonylcarbamoyladenosine synthetase subunit TsaC/SUA5/YrdC
MTDPDATHTDGKATDIQPSYWTAEEVDAAIDTMRRGGLILVKGDIGYGLFGITEQAIAKMYRLKGRQASNPCIFVGNLALMDEIAAIGQPEVREWIAQTAGWTTLAVVLPARTDSPYLRSMDPWVRERSVTRGSLAIFLRTGPYVEQLIARAFGEGWVFVGSSANKSLTGNVFRFEDLPPEIVAGADLAVDHGVASLINPQRRATTIVNFTNWTIRREGVNHEQIRASFERLRKRVAPLAGAAHTGQDGAR